MQTVRHNDAMQRAHNDHVTHRVNPNGMLLAAKGEGVGPSAKGQQKRSVHEQFFFLQKFANSFKFFYF
jgi:hypothetical protein